MGANETVCAGEDFVTTITTSNIDDVETLIGDAFVDADVVDNQDGTYTITIDGKQTAGNANKKIEIKEGSTVHAEAKIIECPVSTPEVTASPRRRTAARRE